MAIPPIAFASLIAITLLLEHRRIAGAVPEKHVKGENDKDENEKGAHISRAVSARKKRVTRRSGQAFLSIVIQANMAASLLTSPTSMQSEGEGDKSER
jgi:hypothetical protein